MGQREVITVHAFSRPLMLLIALKTLQHVLLT